MIIPLFISHSGCPHQCVFCNQKSITGQAKSIEPSALPQKITEYLRSNRKSDPVQVAFYGGSFTALPLDAQRDYLKAARQFISTGQITGIRLSTRPDCINPAVLALLKEYQVRTIELGAQSMNDNVLALAGRGHTAADTVNSVKLLKEYGFTIGLQLIIGLPGDSGDIFSNTVSTAIDLKPAFVRLYPLLVIKGTMLEKIFNAGKYTPLSLDDAVLLCRDALIRFEQAGIEVIRIGLQPTEELEKSGSILAGPYHPAFRQLVESSIFLDKMRSALRERTVKNDSAEFRVNPDDVSAAIGQRRTNIEILKKEFGLRKIHVVGVQNVQARREPVLVDRS